MHRSHLHTYIHTYIHPAPNRTHLPTLLPPVSSPRDRDDDHTRTTLRRTRHTPTPIPVAIDLRSELVRREAGTHHGRTQQHVTGHSILGALGHRLLLRRLPSHLPVDDIRERAQARDRGLPGRRSTSKILSFMPCSLPSFLPSSSTNLVNPLSYSSSSLTCSRHVI
jgi:hypothetical protein